MTIKYLKAAIFFIFYCQNLWSGEIWVVGKTSNDVTILKSEDLSFIKKIEVGKTPHEVLLSKNGEKALVSIYGNYSQMGNSIDVLDLESNSKERTLDLASCKMPHGITTVKEPKLIALTCEGSSEIVIVDIQSGKLVKNIPTKENTPHMVAYDSLRNRLLVSNIGSGSVSIISLKELKVEKNIPSGKGSEGIAYNHKTDRFWVSNREENTISIFDADSLNIINKIKTGKFPIRVSFYDKGKKAVVSLYHDDSVQIFDTSSFNLIKEIKLSTKKSSLFNFFSNKSSSNPIGHVVDSNSSTLYISLSKSNEIVSIDLQTYKIKNRTTVYDTPDGILYKN